ncbi:hypothetical protein ACE7GA_23260 [Roseomonas sp. CCTCC AB2023176]|uniref:hypothetical protein n=1 Tax=Roseomonas sp. CCTCC AB2023176 TaxID=3342640 RepID=UPI0035DD3451
MREHVRRSIFWGGPCGAIAVVVFRDGTLWPLHYVAKVMPLWGLVTTVGPHGLPWIAWFMLLGFGGGMLIALILRLLPLPDLLTGAAVGLAAGFLVPQNWPAGTPEWAPLLASAAWGWGTAFLLRPMALRGRD